jgi:hypothetical protein
MWECLEGTIMSDAVFDTDRISFPNIDIAFVSSHENIRLETKHANFKALYQSLKEDLPPDMTPQNLAFYIGVAIGTGKGELSLNALLTVWQKWLGEDCSVFNELVSLRSQ